MYKFHIITNYNRHFFSEKQSRPAVVSEPKEEAASEQVQKEAPKSTASTGRRNRFSKPAKSTKTEEVVAEESSSPAAVRAGRGRFSSRS